MSKLQLKSQNLLILAVLFALPVYLIKIKFGWVSFNVLEGLISILFFVWIFNKEKKYKIQNTKYKIPVLLLFIGLILSLLANGNIYSGLGAIKGWFIFPIIFAIIFYDALKKDDSLLKKSLLVLFFSGVAVSLVGIVYKILGIVTYDGRLRIFWDSPNQLAMFLAIPFLIGISFILLPCSPRWSIGEAGPRGGARRAEGWEQNKSGLWKTSVAFFCSSLIFINLCFTRSFGAWIGIVVALAIYISFKYNKIWQKKYIVVFLIILLIFIDWEGFNKFENTKNLDGRSSLASREMIWQSSLLMVKNNPLFGIGPGNFQNKYLEYQKYFPPYLEWSAPQPHNVFLAFWLQSGLVGLIGFIWILILFFQDNKIAIVSNREMGLVLLAIMIYILVHGLVDTTYWRNDLAVVFWVIIAANLYLSPKREG